VENKIKGGKMFKKIICIVLVILILLVFVNMGDLIIKFGKIIYDCILVGLVLSFGTILGTIIDEEE